MKAFKNVLFLLSSVCFVWMIVFCLVGLLTLAGLQLVHTSTLPLSITQLVRQGPSQHMRIHTSECKLTQAQMMPQLPNAAYHDNWNCNFSKCADLYIYLFKVFKWVVDKFGLYIGCICICIYLFINAVHLHSLENSSSIELWFLISLFKQMLVNKFKGHKQQENLVWHSLLGFAKLF